LRFCAASLATHQHPARKCFLMCTQCIYIQHARPHSGYSTQDSTAKGPTYGPVLQVVPQ
jgi:hypothetical protein